VIGRVNASARESHFHLVVEAVDRDAKHPGRSLEFDPRLHFYARHGQSVAVAPAIETVAIRFEADIRGKLDGALGIRRAAFSSNVATAATEP
jgi:hypothetical protein